MALGMEVGLCPGHILLGPRGPSSLHKKGGTQSVCLNTTDVLLNLALACAGHYKQTNDREIAALVSWSLTSLFSTNMAISETKEKLRKFSAFDCTDEVPIT